MRKIKYLALIIIGITVSNCSKNEIKKQNIDDFINLYHIKDFSEFKDYTIAIRQKTFNETIYIVSDSDANIDDVICFVTVNKISGKIDKIKRVDQNLSNEREKQIESLIYKYRKYDFPYLSVDNDNNFSVNPFFIDMKPYLLFLHQERNKLKIKKNFMSFKYYKENWYVRD
ncbi:hypothetical protein [Flavobacterium cerinum]|uniref:Lipoprotein n=1 Tax=Flavobacterium cerinum TaxID=2502784 RepID=A0ABY5IV43_9FLAO|nr:hypothetical protein [Flavobacterium cerinum]UUC45199.1 hypothetical protein NOX80_16435 [Flavobacterium cerinum]